jgi:chromosome segregation ATPase
MASPQAPGRSRRRQRSTRITVSVALLVLAAVLVVGAVVSGSTVLIAVAAVLGVLLGAAATRITNAELAASRRDAARDRAEQAQAYRALTEARTTEQSAFAEVMRSRVERHEASIHELEDALTAAQGRAADAARKAGAEARRADAAERDNHELATDLTAARERAAEAIVRVAELEQELDAVRAELDVVTEAWHVAEAQRKRA